ncbi:S8 family serine peptidase [Archangium violaceum]|uniref:S8 family serine peptidase n=1 Tax=Archangium violaceum TaxID=83451 RepID=UPI002B2DF6FB|nr:S8 family serine peptidase [Archangium gephyra]
MIHQTGYARRLTMVERLPDKALLEELGTRALAIFRGGGPGSREPLATLGDLRLYLLEREEVQQPAEGLVVAEPVLCVRRGRKLLGPEDRFVGIDDEVCTTQYLLDLYRPPEQPQPSPRHVPPMWAPSAAPEPDLLIAALENIGLPAALGLLRNVPRRPRLALIDESFEGLPDRFALTPTFRGVPRHSQSEDLPAMEPSHGTRMAATLVEALGETVELGLFKLLPEGEPFASAWLTPADLTLTLAHVIQEWKADLIMIPASNGLWGMPGYLRAVLRETQRCRGGRGVPIFCSVGDPTRNHDEPGSGPFQVLGADELASQPYVIAIASTDAAGRWYRRFNRTNSRPLNRFGPAVALSAPGDFHRLSQLERRLADDSSLATALAAASAAVVLRSNPELSTRELLEVLRQTADVPPIVDDGAGPPSETFNGWDRDGHNFKLGAGRINALSGVLAAVDPVCASLLLTRSRPGRIPSRGAAEADPAFLCAAAWYGWTGRQTMGTLSPEAWRLLQGYLELREKLSWLLLHSRPLRDALLWLARHLVALQFAPDHELDRQGQREHGALFHRVTHTLEVLRDEVATHFSKDAALLLPWLESVESFLVGLKRPGAEFLRFLYGPRGAFTAMWLPHPALSFP